MLLSTSLLVMSAYDTYSYSLSIFSILWSTENINSVLGIILMVLSICNILWTAGYKIYTYIKNKQYDKVSKEIEDAIDKIKDIKEDK